MFSGEVLATDPSFRPTVTSPPPMVYRIDRADRIVYVDERWNEFARQNGADRLVTRVLGRNLWDFISGRELRQLQLDWFTRIRESGTSSRLNFRCDAPDRRRSMEIAIAPRLGGVLEVQCRIVSETPRPTIPVLTEVPERSPEVLTLCSWCKRALVGQEWAEIEVAIPMIGNVNVDFPPSLTHGICQACRDQITGQINDPRLRVPKRLA
jgi:hypothetical protein